MNIFRNPYVDPDSFQSKGKVNDYYRNPANPHTIHVSKDTQEGAGHKGIQQRRKANNPLEKINDSKPVMFSPPKVESIQKPLREKTLDEEPLTADESKKLETEKKDKEVITNLIKEFSHMLDDTPSKHEGFITLPESESENDSLLNSSESTTILENKLGTDYTNDIGYKNNAEDYIYQKYGNSEMLFDAFHSMLDGRKEHSIYNTENIESSNQNNDSIEDRFLTMLSESVELQEQEDSVTNEAYNETLNKNNDTLVDKFYSLLLENDHDKQDSNTLENAIDTLNENVDTLEDKFLTILLESDNLQREKKDSSYAKLKETKSDEIEDLMIGELHVCHKDPSSKKVKKRKYCINKKNPHHKSCLKKIDDECFFQKNTHLIDQVEKGKKTTVKMQVLLARLETDIDIIETIDLLLPLDNILKVEWSIHSLDCKVVLPSKTVFLKGELSAEIEYGNKESENKIQSLKVIIPWSKTADINWISTPDFPHSSQNEFMFRPHHEQDSDLHYEARQKFAEPVHSQLEQVNFVWYEKLNLNEKNLQFNGVAQLSVNFMQEQFVVLDCYSK